MFTNTKTPITEMFPWRSIRAIVCRSGFPPVQMHFRNHCLDIPGKFSCAIDHFTVVFLVTWPLNGNEAGGDLVLIQTLLLLLCKSRCSFANQLAFKWEQQRGLYQNKVTSSLACIHSQVTKNTTVKWPVVSYRCKMETTKNRVNSLQWVA